MTARFESQSEPIPGYRLLDRLGSGGFGEVWRAEAPGGIFKAIKIVFGDITSEDRDVVRFAEQELKALKRVKQVRHPYLLALDRYDIVEGRLLITMELADRNLWDRYRECRKQGLPGIPRPELMVYMAETAEVLDLMNIHHQLQHLDIKPQNLFLLYNHVKVADFGQVKDLEGMAAQVTGGITPVYAAPETFDGLISRYCDQYSLACVYQELLTGRRPFEGTSMQQLLMQHLQAPPDLSPSPSADRPALARALAKKPDDRFPTCTDMVTALRKGTTEAVRVGLPEVPPSAVGESLARPGTDGPGVVSDRIDLRLDAPGTAPPPTSIPPPAPPSPASVPAYSPPDDRPPAETRSSGITGWPADPPAAPTADEPTFETAPPLAPAPPEEAGPGPLRPTLVIGVGYTGLRVLQRLRAGLADRFGPAERVPVVRTLYVDTDPDALAAAVAVPPPGLAGLRPEDVFAARLNRAQHYLKPRLSGRSLIEGWFDQQLLYRLPRNPITLGVRGFGRLAFCDHYRGLIQKVQAELEAALDPDAMAASRATTGLDIRTNRPRVYVAAGLGGGTGGGMFVDLAYTVRARLKRLGYPDPEVVGLLHVPPDGEAHPQTLANAYAALTELHHYDRPDTQFAATYDDRPAHLRDTAPPFSRVYLLPGLAGGLDPVGPGSGAVPTGNSSRGSITMSGTHRNPGPRASGVRAGGSRPSGVAPVPARRETADVPPPDRDPCTLAADIVRLGLVSGVGRTVDEATADPAARAEVGHVRTAGAARFTWPRGAVVAQTGQLIAHALVNHWAAPSPDHIRAVIPERVNAQWFGTGLDPDDLGATLRAAAEEAVGGRIDVALANLTEPLAPRGWLGRLPDPDRVSAGVDQIRRLIGRPGGKTAAQTQTPVELALAAAADRAADRAAAEATQLFLELFEQPEFRPAGTEEAVRQFLVKLEQASATFERQVVDLEHAGGAAYDLLVGYVHYQKGMRKPSAGEFAEALRRYPEDQHRAVYARARVHVYQRVKAAMVGLLHEVETCRHRVEGLLPTLAPSAPAGAHAPAARDLFPVGCSSVPEAAQMFLGVLTDDDLMALDRRVQHALVADYDGLFHACLNATDGMAGVLALVQAETRAYLDDRLGDVDLAGMFWQRYGTPDAVGRELSRAYTEAAPDLIGPGPWSRAEVGVFAGPTGDGGDPVREVAAGVLPPTILADEVRDEVVLYREYPAVPMSALAQFGPAWEAAYKAAFEIQQTSAHTRLDVTHWVDVDSV